MTKTPDLAVRVFADLMRTRDTDVTGIIMSWLIASVPIAPAAVVPSERIAVALARAVHDSYAISRLPPRQLRFLRDALRDQPWQGSRWISSPWVFEMACAAADMTTPIAIRACDEGWAHWRNYHVESGQPWQIARWIEAEHIGVLRELSTMPPTLLKTNGSGALH